MLEQNQLNNVMNFYVLKNIELTQSKINVLEKFRKKESHLKDYIEALSELEKQQHRINLKNFHKLRDTTLRILYDFNTEDMNDNIEKVVGIKNFFVEVEKELMEIFDVLSHTKKLWHSFISRNSELSNSKITVYVEQRFENAFSHMKNLVPQEIGVVFSEIESIRQEIERIMIITEKIKNAITLNVFIGKEYQDLYNKIKLFLYEANELDIHEYITQLSDHLEQIEEIKSSSRYGKTRVPLVKVYNKFDRSIYKYTVMFGDHLVEYDSFFKNKEALVIKDTNEFLYFENYPIHGIYSGKEIVEQLAYDENFFDLVSEISKKSTTSFIALAFLIIVSGILFSFLGLYAIVFHIILSIMVLFGFNHYLLFVKKKLEEKYLIKKAFIFIETNFVVSKIGEDINLKDILVGIIYDFDNTILNEDYQNWRESHKEI